MPERPQVEKPLRYTVAETAAPLKICRTTLYERIGAGLIDSHLDGRRRYVLAAMSRH